MRSLLRFVPALGLAAACTGRADDAVLTPAHAAAIRDSVRVFAGAIAREVTRDGPAAWRHVFSDAPEFFMASEGQLVFATGDAATQGIASLTHVIAHIELTWGDSLRIDPVAPGLAMLGATYHEVRVDTAGHRVDEAGYFTGLAEHRPAGWQLRNAHWSVRGPPPGAR